jgi:hypothetical protein
MRWQGKLEFYSRSFREDGYAAAREVLRKAASWDTWNSLFNLRFVKMADTPTDMDEVLDAVERRHSNEAAALALALPQSARQAAENAERAGLLEWLCQYSESRFSQWMATYKAGTMLGHMTLLEALRAAREADRG